ncbi:Zinc finger, SWIM-type [Phytophthora cactorum]|nr:Zinc finger, SWIM-type [Phytophthora cactorum]
MHTNSATSRHPDVVPEFLSLWLPFERLNAGEGSLAMGLFHGGFGSNNMSKRGYDVGEWEVKTRGYTHQCNDVQWSCSCLFYCSYNLPCHHLMYIVGKVHRFEILPISSIPRRWDRMDMSSMVQAFTEGVEMLQTVQNTMRTASESFTHDGLTLPSDVYELNEATQVSEATQGATLDVSGDEKYAR